MRRKEYSSATAHITSNESEPRILLALSQVLLTFC
jgi:hypothetical protein